MSGWNWTMDRLLWVVPLRTFRPTSTVGGLSFITLEPAGGSGFTSRIGRFLNKHARKAYAVVFRVSFIFRSRQEATDRTRDRQNWARGALTAFRPAANFLSSFGGLSDGP